MSEIKYKRILIINDDDSEESFFDKYENLKEYKNIIYYCNERQAAFQFITKEDFGGFDKIILDIKIDWQIPEEYKDEIKKYIDVEALKQVNMGFLFFMFLISRGYPIKRIAFLSAYIKEEDSERAKKKSLLDEMKGFKQRCLKNDDRIREYLDYLPSLKVRISDILGDDKRKGNKAYKEIRRLLEDDVRDASYKEKEMSSNDGGETENNEKNKQITNNEQFFQRLNATGLKVEKKISKSDKHALEKWIEDEESEELKHFYNFRNEVLNICEIAVKKPKEKQAIYDLYKCRKNFLENYQWPYFDDMMRKIRNEISNLGEAKNIGFIVENFIHSIVSFWESLSITNIGAGSNEDDLSNYAITMVLKHTRNWFAHGRVKKANLAFCKFIFYLSIRIIYGRDAHSEIETFIFNINKINPDQISVTENSGVYRKIWEEINKQVKNSPRKKFYTYTLDLSDLYYRYSNSENGKNDKNREEINLDTADLYGMFILCLHYPDIDVEGKKLELKFNKIDYAKQEKYIIFLEQMAEEQFEMIKSAASLMGANATGGNSDR